MRNVAVVLSLAASASAQPGPSARDSVDVELRGPDVRWMPDSGGQLPVYDELTAKVRLGSLDRAVARARSPIERANAVLARAMFAASHARHERLLALTATLRGDEAKSPATRHARAVDINRHSTAASQANLRAISDLTDIYCETGDRARGLACSAPAALAAWPSMDQAVLLLAWVLANENRSADAARAYRRLTESPRSRSGPEAAVWAGDLAFELHQLEDAERMYTAGKHAASAVIRTYARYRLGWVQLARGRSEDAFASFRAVTVRTGSDPQTLRLVREARHDLVVAFAEWGSAGSARTLFERIAPGHSVDMLATLGDLWLEQGKHLEAIAIFAELHRRAPFDVRGCAWQASATRGALVVLDRKAVVSEIERLHAALGRMRKLGRVKAGDLAACTAATRGLTTDLVLSLHDAQRRLTAETLDTVDHLYRLLVDTFPLDEGTAKVRYQRAEAAWLRAEIDDIDPHRSWSIVVKRYDEALAAGVKPGVRKILVQTRALARQRVALAATAQRR